MEIRRHDALAEVEPAGWQGLAAASTPGTVFQTQAWLGAWWRTFGTDHELLLLTAHDRGRMVGIAPLCVTREGAMRFVGHGRSDYADLLIAPGREDVRKRLWQDALDQARGWQKLELRCLLRDSPSIDMLRGLSVRGHVHPPTRCPTLRIADPGALQRVRNRAHVKRRAHWFRRHVGYQAVHLQDPEEVLPWLDDFFDQHRRRWAGTHPPSLFAQADNQRFYRAATIELGEAGLLRFTRVSLGEQAIAYHFGFVHEGTFTWYKPSFEIEWAPRSPGVALLAELFDRAASEGLREFDFALGDEAFKQRYANDARWSVDATFYASAIEHGLAQATRLGKGLFRPLVQRLRGR